MGVEGRGKTPGNMKRYHFVNVFTGYEIIMDGQLALWAEDLIGKSLPRFY